MPPLFFSSLGTDTEQTDPCDYTLRQSGRVCTCRCTVCRMGAPVMWWYTSINMLIFCRVGCGKSVEPGAPGGPDSFQGQIVTSYLFPKVWTLHFRVNMWRSRFPLKVFWNFPQFKQRKQASVFIFIHSSSIPWIPFKEKLVTSSKVSKVLWNLSFSFS